MWAMLTLSIATNANLSLALSEGVIGFSSLTEAVKIHTVVRSYSPCRISILHTKSLVAKLLLYHDSTQM